MWDVTGNRFLPRSHPKALLSISAASWSILQNILSLTALAVKPGQRREIADREHALRGQRPGKPKTIPRQAKTDNGLNLLG